MTTKPKESEQYPCPEDLKPAERIVWEDTRAELLRRGIMSPAMLIIMKRYAKVVVALERIEKDLEGKETYIQAGKQVVNPANKVLGTYTISLLQLSRALGLSVRADEVKETRKKKNALLDFSND